MSSNLKRRAVRVSFDKVTDFRHKEVRKDTKKVVGQ